MSEPSHFSLFTAVKRNYYGLNIFPVAGPAEATNGNDDEEPDHNDEDGDNKIEGGDNEIEDIEKPEKKASIPSKLIFTNQYYIFLNS